MRSRLRLPLTLMLTLAAAAPAWAATVDVVTVKRGDTLSELAAAHGSTVQQLRSLNGIRGNLIHPGQKLRVRAATAAPAKKVPALPPVNPRAIDNPALAALKKNAPTTVVKAVKVRAGDTLGKIAKAHGVTVSDLMKLNALKSTTIYVGQDLKVSVKSVAAQPGPAVPVRYRGQSVKLVRGKVLGIPVSAVEIDLNDPLVFVTAVLPQRGLGSGALFRNMAQRSGATALVNGGYFHPQTFYPAGDLVIRGRYVSTGRVQVAVALTSDNRVVVQPVQQVRLASYRGYETVIATGPHILRNGVVSTNLYNDGIRDGAVFGRAARSAIGIRDDKRLVLMSSQYPLTPTETAKIMARFGARDAILLDGGSSTGFAWKGNVLVRPARMIAYGIGVFTNYTGKRFTR